MIKPLRIIFLIYVLFISQVSITPQSNGINNFFDALINNDDLSKYVHQDALNRSERLGINYLDVKNKFLISYDIEKNIKEKINNAEMNYQINYEKLDNNFSKAIFQVNNNNYIKEFYFKDEKLISPSAYFIRNWEEKESKFVKYYLSKADLFNDYSMNQLDKFVEIMLNLLKVSTSERQLLEKEKIIYILCKDEDEIEKVSGFHTRGISILAYDEVITTYNCHFHEVAHLLINFKLKNLPLYTLPFLQEGFATAVGGRGGLGRNVLLDIGEFLHKSQFIPFNSIITKSEFNSEDASLTYPVAAIYNLFLIQELGIESYLKLYINYSGDADFVTNLSLSSIKLPPIEKFNSYQSDYNKLGGILLDSNENFKIISEGKAGTIKESENYFQLKIRSNLLLKTANPLADYKSKKFKEVFSNVEYAGYKYLIKADSREVNIYNLYTNILIASYSAGFTINNRNVRQEDGYFIFYVDKDVFEEDIINLIISDI